MSVSYDERKARLEAKRGDDADDDRFARETQLRKAGAFSVAAGCNSCRSTGVCGCYRLDSAEDFADLDDSSYDDDKITMDTYMEDE